MTQEHDDDRRDVTGMALAATQEIKEMQLGKKPAVRQKIETALADYQRGGATPEIRALFTDWSTMVQATLAQATRFELIHEARPEEDRALVDTWFKVMRLRAQQNSVEAKVAKRLRALESQPPIPAAETAAVPSPSEANDDKTLAVSIVDGIAVAAD